MWWKSLCVVLLVYVHIAGLVVPLKPGVFSVESHSCKAGQTCEIDVKLYGSHFRESENMEVWLKFDTLYYLKAHKVSQIEPGRLGVQINLPRYLPTDQEAFTPALIVDHERLGAFVIPSAVSISQDKISEAEGKQLWSAAGVPSFSIQKGFLFPYRNLLMETLRNLYFHVPMWFAMMVLFGVSAFYSIQIVRSESWQHDNKIVAYNTVGLVLGMLGLVTGMIWAHNTWGRFWSWDIKQTTSAITLFMYSAFFMLRVGIRDDVQKYRLSSAYNLFCFAMLIPLLFIIPRMMDSLHPGNGGNPAFAQDDLDNTMRLVFYPAVIGFILLGLWISQLIIRIKAVKDRRESSFL